MDIQQFVDEFNQRIEQKALGLEVRHAKALEDCNALSEALSDEDKDFAVRLAHAAQCYQQIIDKLTYTESLLESYVAQL